MSHRSFIDHLMMTFYNDHVKVEYTKRPVLFVSKISDLNKIQLRKANTHIHTFTHKEYLYLLLYSQLKGLGKGNCKMNIAI